MFGRSLKKRPYIIMSIIGAAALAGGLSVAGSVGSSYLGNFLGMKNSAKSAERQYQYFLRSLVDGPSRQVKGLRKANLNPLLATGLGSGGTNVGVSAPQPQFDNFGNAVASGLEAAVKAQSYKQLKADTKIAESEADAAEAESSARQAQAYTDKLEAIAASAALTGVRPIVRVNDRPSILESPQFDRIVKKLENQIEYDSYMRSKGHAIWEDTINAVHGINQGSSAYEHWKSARRSYNSSGRYSR